MFTVSKAHLMITTYGMLTKYNKKVINIEDRLLELWYKI